MAVYCYAGDVVRELPNIEISVATKPSTSEVYQFCVDISADMEARMRAVGIITPVIDADLVKVLKREFAFIQLPVRKNPVYNFLNHSLNACGGRLHKGS